ncbi:MAG: sporulation protein YunB [Firmicutes bacterium]|nr:sporulation protein YunB [Bacillota bacterium]
MRQQPRLGFNRRRRAVRAWNIETVILVALLVFGTALFVIDVRLRPTILAYAEARALTIATDAINSAVNDKIAISIKYEDLIDYRQDNQGRIVAMRLNTGEINRLASQTTIQVQSTLRSISEDRIRIPLGQALGSQILANYGPWITVRIKPLGTVQSTVVDKFEQAGINQSRHKIYLEVTATIQVVIPLVSSTVVVTSEVPIAENIILGEVPEVYVGSEATGIVVPSR